MPCLCLRGIIIIRIRSVTSEAASYRERPTSEVVGSVTTSTCSCGRTCMHVLTTERAAVSIASSRSVSSPIETSDSSAIAPRPVMRVPLFNTTT